MKKNLLIFTTLMLFGCSPYKKVTLTMSELQTQKWQNESENNVTSKLGQYKRKENTDIGYKIVYDYSTYYIPKKVNYTSQPNYTVKVAPGVSTPMPINNRSQGFTQKDLNQLQEVQTKRILEFYFNKENKVEYVFADGYPDSVKYVLRKNH